MGTKRNFIMLCVVAIVTSVAMATSLAIAQEPQPAPGAQPAPPPQRTEFQCASFRTDTAMQDLLRAVDSIALYCEQNNLRDAAQSRPRCPYKMCKQEVVSAPGQDPTLTVDLSVTQSLPFGAPERPVDSFKPPPNPNIPNPGSMPITNGMVTSFPNLTARDSVTLSLRLFVPFEGRRDSYQCNNPLTVTVQDYFIRTVTSLYLACQ